MTLLKEDGQLYYRLWLPLLDYVNRKYEVRKEMGKMGKLSEVFETKQK